MEQMTVKKLIEVLSQLDPDMLCEVEGERDLSDAILDVMNINIRLIRGLKIGL